MRVPHTGPTSGPRARCSRCQSFVDALELPLDRVNIDPIGWVPPDRSPDVPVQRADTLSVNAQVTLAAS